MPQAYAESMPQACLLGHVGGMLKAYAKDMPKAWLRHVLNACPGMPEVCSKTVRSMPQAYAQSMAEYALGTLFRACWGNG